MDFMNLKGNRMYNNGPNTSGNGVKPKIVTPIVHAGGIVEKKKPLLQEFKDSLIKKPNVDLGTYLVRDCVVPMIQNTILDYLSMRFFGTPMRGNGVNRGSNVITSIGQTIASYGQNLYRGNVTDYSRQYGQQQGMATMRDNINYHDIIILDPEDAKGVVRQMREFIGMYQEATVSDLLSLVGITANSVDDDWGWTNPNDIGLRRVPEGYLIDVADAIYLRR